MKMENREVVDTVMIQVHDYIELKINAENDVCYVGKLRYMNQDTHVMHNRICELERLLWGREVAK